MVPAMVVRRPWIGKRLMRWMPERPAVMAAQVSCFPCPSEVTMPMPVTATRGRPFLSRCIFGNSLCCREAQGALAAPVPDRGHERFARLPFRDQGRGQRDTGRRLPLHGMADRVAGGVNRRAGCETGHRLELLAR